MTIYIGNRIRQIQPLQHYYDALPGSTIGYVKGNQVDNEVVITGEAPIENLPQRALSLKMTLSEEISCLEIYPGFQPKIIEAIAKQGTRAILLKLYHSGTACMRNTEHKTFSVIEPIRAAIETGILVFFLPTPVCNGNVFRYPSSKALQDVGAIALPPMTFEAATVKLMWCLGQSTKPEVVKALMRNNIVGEICPTISSKTCIPTR